jgi:cell wall assembly regulator SMI1
LIAGNLAPPADDAVLGDAEALMGRALPDELNDLLKIHNGGREVVGGWNLLSAESVVEKYRLMQKYSGEADVPEHLQGLLNTAGSAGWIPFVSTVSGDYLCIDVAPGPVGTVGQIFGWNHDGEADRPVAPSLTAWLERVVACVETGEIVYDTDREEFLPFYGSAGFALAFQADPPLRFDASRSEAPVHGPQSVAVAAVEAAGPLPEGCRIELTQAGTVVHGWDVDMMREAEECATEFNVLVDDPKPWVPIGADAVLSVRGLAPDDIVWVHLATNGPRQDDL